MRRVYIALFLALFVLPQVLALNLTVQKGDIERVMVQGINSPVEYDLNITNNGPSDSLMFYNLLGFTMSPEESIQINSSETKEVKVLIYPRENLDFKGFYYFKYFIRAKDDTELEQRAILKIVNLGTAFKIGAGEINTKENSLSIYIKNKEDFTFKNLHVNFSSPFFEISKVVNLSPNEQVDFKVNLNKDDFEELIAGFYTLTADLSEENATGKVEGTIKFSENSNLVVTKDKYGILVRSQLIDNENQGNTLAQSETTVSKNIISRLFTSFDPVPDNAQRKGFFVDYTWQRELKPGENFTVRVKTNWFFLFLILVLVVVIVALVKKYSQRDLILKKRVGFVRTKGGEFALKITIRIHAQNYVERVSILDRLPQLLKIHPRFGHEQPLRVDEQNRRIEWGFEKLEAGETRILSYIVYSKVGVLGKFALPQTTSIYEREGKVKEANSNRTFFVAEQKKGEKDE